MRALNWFYTLPMKLRSLLRWGQLDQELDAELRDHLERKIEENISRGMSEQEASRAALIAMDGMERVKEECRDTRRVNFIHNILQDLRFGFRMLRKNPGFSAVAVLTLALGIGATTAIFSIVEGVLLRPLPFPHPEQLVILTDRLQGSEIPGNIGGVTAPDVVNYTRDTHSFTALGGFDKRQTAYELSGTGEPTQIIAVRMTPGVFAALGVQPLFGRVFTQQEDDQHQQVIVLSYATWKSRYQGDPAMLGRKILLDRKPYVVIGIMPRNFEFPLVPGHLNRGELWIPMSFQPEELTGSEQATWGFRMIGRLKPGISAERAREHANRVAQETMRNYPAFMSGLHISPAVRALSEDTIGSARPLVRTLFLAVVVVLLIACANLAGLLLVRAIRRRREIAVRLALGSGARTLLRQALLESLVLSVTGGVFGLLLASAALRIGTSLLPETLPLISDIGLDWSVVAFALALAIFTGVVCGLLPAFAAIRTSVNETLKEGGRTGTSGSGHARLRSGLVIAEIAVAIVLVAASGLLLRSFEKMRDANLGYRTDHLVAAGYNLPRQQYGTQTAVDTFNRALLDRLQTLPGVTHAGLTSFLPANGTNGNSAFVAEGYTPAKPGSIPLGTSIQVEGDVISTMGTPLLRGRLFTPADNQPNSQLVTIVNRTLADQCWSGQDPIGRRLRIGTPEMQTPWLTVVGEVAEMKEGSPDAGPRPQFYIPVDQAEKDFGALGNPATDLNGNGGYMILRTSMPPELVENELRAAVRSLDPQLPLFPLETMDHALSDSEAPRRFNTVLISSFAGAALLLAILGIYSVIAFTVALRAQEMAIRMALGSQRSGIVGLVLASGAKLAAAGCVLGLIGAVAASRLLQSLVFGVKTWDPLTLAVAAILVMLLALAASLLPARRAASTNPVEALRAQ
jgi:putative ABC transport system permease protein